MGGGEEGRKEGRKEERGWELVVKSLWNPGFLGARRKPTKLDYCRGGGEPDPVFFIIFKSCHFLYFSCPENLHPILCTSSTLP